MVATIRNHKSSPPSVATLLLIALIASVPVEGIRCKASETAESTANHGRVISSQAQASLICNVTIAASMAGEVSDVDIVEGQKIASGDRLVQFDTELAQVELKACQRAFEALDLQAANDVDARFARRSFDVHIREFEQNEAANQKYLGTVSETELDRLRLVVDQSRLGIEQAEHEQKVAAAQAGEKLAAVGAAAVRLRKHSIVAPRSAQVAEVFVQVGQHVDAGEPIARLIDLESLRIECLVDANQASQTKAGDRIEFHYGDDSVSAGKVDFVSPEIHPVTGQVRILASVNNKDQELRPGTRGRLIAVP